MSILLERTKQTQAPAYQGEPVHLAPRIGAGQVTRYLVQEGQRAVQGKIIAKVTDAEGMPWDITAPFAGTVQALPYGQGDTFPVGAAIAYLLSDAPQAPQKASKPQPAPTVAEPRKSQPAASGEASHPSAQRVATPELPATPPQPTTPQPPAIGDNPRSSPIGEPIGSILPTGDNLQPVVVAAHNGRRSTMGEPAELVEVEELHLPQPLPQPVKRPKRAKIVKRTCHPTDQQAQQFDNLVMQLTKRGFDYSSGELQRLAFHLLLQLSERELVEQAEANRDREVAGRYGYGARPQG